MAKFTRSDDLRGAEFNDVDLRGARFVGADLSGVVMRGVDARGVDVDAPWLLDGESSLLVNGVDVLPFVEAELNRRFPGRAQRRTADPDGLRSAWAALDRTWAATLDRVATMPAGTVDVSVGGEWSFDPDCPETTLSCLHTILKEEWEHHRYAVRDLDAIAARPAE